MKLDEQLRHKVFLDLVAKSGLLSRTDFANAVDKQEVALRPYYKPTLRSSGSPYLPSWEMLHEMANKLQFKVEHSVRLESNG